MTESLAVDVEGLRKRYGDKDALAGFDLRVARGAVHGLLGPNGAGKTTAVRILSTLVKADGGRAVVAGCDVATQAPLVRNRIGLVGQNSAVDEVLSGRQNLTMFGRLYHLSRADARRRAEQLLEQFELVEAGDKQVKTYSGGMRRRLDLAAGMILTPRVLFLDEPTTGLDPRGRNEMWEAVRGLVAQGTTVLLTTQYLDEADQLASRISVIARGAVIAEGTPDDLKSDLGGDRVEVVLHSASSLSIAAHALERLMGTSPRVDHDDRQVTVPVQNGKRALAEIVRVLDDIGAPLDDIALRRPTLDEVFLHVTGTSPDESTDKAAANSTTSSDDEVRT